MPCAVEKTLDHHRCGAVSATCVQCLTQHHRVRLRFTLAVRIAAVSFCVLIFTGSARKRKHYTRVFVGVVSVAGVFVVSLLVPKPITNMMYRKAHRAAVCSISHTSLGIYTVVPYNIQCILQHYEPHTLANTHSHSLHGRANACEMITRI